MTGTTEAAGASRSPGDRPTATSIPARWRIVGWIVLTTALVLLGLGLTLRALLMTEVDRTANDDVVQELDEFRTFASEGVDPTTAEPFDSPERLLRLYLGRQIPAANEVHLGMDSARVFAVDRSADASSPVDGEPYNLAEDGQLIEEIRTSTAPSGIAESPVGPVRWGKVSINDSDSTFVIAVFTGPDRAEVDAMIRVFAWGSVAGLALTALFGYVVAGQILAPVREVRTVAERIQENDLDGRVPVHGRDDISQLAETFNAMLDRISAAYDTQRRFVDDAGHELRTPITVIRGHLETMSPDEEPAARAETMRLVDSELDRMSRIVTDLLTIAKSERPDFVKPRAVDAAELLLDIESQAQQLGDRQWELVEIAEGEATLDPQRITQAVLQLATNAVTHTEPGGRIRIGSRWVEDRLVVSVADDGPGVRAEDAQRIFRRFDRGTDGVPAASGAGLGLSIVTAIAAAHGGTVTLDSTPGEGATFAVDIPAAERQQSERHPSASPQESQS
ncbi:two-component sensor histidine kinase [Dietzia sp. NCCP-2495]|uniref:sensor histidine kinase n=1 Tax=Dietzia sp. NCCP-2495 TaxID=2934675 RepID=UPI00223231F6|nr:HAMP domain-containing sensor histidine kinase [Dietzia sp. NCCP-2495]GLB63658.1 two-component sensor histidine kinase [Dietzia sp. NCCP-2495]